MSRYLFDSCMATNELCVLNITSDFLYFILYLLLFYTDENIMEIYQVDENHLSLFYISFGNGKSTSSFPKCITTPMATIM